MRADNPHERLTQDALTGLPNEQLFRAHLAAEFGRAREQERNGALLVVRVDTIVAINARHGRSGGDEALRAIAAVMESYRSGQGQASQGREDQVVFKLAGPLFGYSMPSCTAPEARAAAEAIHEKVQGSEGFLERLTVSIGVVNYHELFLEEGTREHVAEHVEQTALYRLGIAARQGSNTICDTSETAAAIISAQPVVLLVEPDPPSMELVVRALEASGVAVQVVADGETALQAIQDSPPRAIICEAMSPRLSGFTLRDRLRNNALWNAIPFILVSYRKNEELIRKAVERDIRHYFRKPVSLTELTGLIVNITRAGAG
jgi:diguanylate cyclase (GGDEF)-like protein